MTERYREQKDLSGFPWTGCEDWTLSLFGRSRMMDLYGFVGSWALNTSQGPVPMVPWYSGIGGDAPVLAKAGVWSSLWSSLISSVLVSSVRSTLNFFWQFPTVIAVLSDSCWYLGQTWKPGYPRQTLFYLNASWSLFKSFNCHQTPKPSNNQKSLSLTWAGP